MMMKDFVATDNRTEQWLKQKSIKRCYNNDSTVHSTAYLHGGGLTPSQRISGGWEEDIRSPVYFFSLNGDGDGINIFF